MSRRGRTVLLAQSVACLCVSAAHGQTLKKERELSAPVRIVSAVTCEAGSDIVGIGADGVLYVWKTPSPEPRKIEIADGPARGALACGAGKILAVALKEGNGKVVVLDTENGAVRQRIDAQSGVMALAISPEGEFLAIATSLYPTQVWDLQTGQKRWTGVTNLGATWTTSISPNGQMVLSADEDTNVRMYDSLGKQLYATEAVVLEPFASAFSDDGKTFAVAGADGAIRLFDTSTGKIVKISSKAGNPIFGVCVSPDGKKVAALVVDDFKLEPVAQTLWDTQSGETKKLEVDPKSVVGAGTNRSHLALILQESGDKLSVVSVE